MQDTDLFLWVEKYRPRTIAETILPPALKATFQKFVEKKEVPNLLLTGRTGVGKTTVARAMLDELNADHIIINGSLEGRQIDVLRNDIMNYASSMSLQSARRKYVILDEADYLNPHSVQPALRNFMEEYSKNCGFILTCNFKGKIIDALHSRCSVVEFGITSKDKPVLASQFFKRVIAILKAENVDYDNASVAQFITKFFPDFRRTLNELQRYAATGKIDSGILVDLEEQNLKTLVALMKEKNFTGIRKWVADNSDLNSADLFRGLYDHCANFLVPSSIPVLILILARYQYQDNFAMIREINTAGCFLEIMAECLFQ